MAQSFKTRKKIEAWLDRYEVYDYTLIPHEKYGHIVDVEGNVYLSDKHLKSIPVKFNTVLRSFYCESNHLTSVDFAPTQVGGSFNCSRNQLTSLLGAPKSVGAYFDCRFNCLTSLQYCPETVGKIFDCCNNTILNFEYCPQHVASRFFCDNNEALGACQKIIDFQKIYQFHKEFVNIKKEKQLLTDLIKLPPIQSKQHKI